MGKITYPCPVYTVYEIWRLYNFGQIARTQVFALWERTPYDRSARHYKDMPQL